MLNWAKFWSRWAIQKKPITVAIKKESEEYKNTFNGFSVKQIWSSGAKQKNKAHGGNGIVLVPNKNPDNIDKSAGVEIFFKIVIP